MYFWADQAIDIPRRGFSMNDNGTPLRQESQSGSQAAASSMFGSVNSRAGPTSSHGVSNVSVPGETTR